MSGNIKINPQIAQGTEGVFGNQAVELQGLISKINSEVTANVGSGKPGWEGAQADAFVSAWENEFKTALNKLVMKHERDKAHAAAAAE